MTSTIDAVMARAQMFETDCKMCNKHVHRGAPRVIVDPSWGTGRHVICRPCWVFLLKAAAAVAEGGAHGCGHCGFLIQNAFTHQLSLPDLLGDELEALLHDE